MLLYFRCSTVCIYSTFNTILQRSPKNVPVRVSIEALYRVEWFSVSMTDDPHDAQFFFFFFFFFCGGGGGGFNVFYYSDNHHHHQSQQELFVTFGNYKR